MILSVKIINILPDLADNFHDFKLRAKQIFPYFFKICYSILKILSFDRNYFKRYFIEDFFHQLKNKSFAELLIYNQI